MLINGWPFQNEKKKGKFSIHSRSISRSKQRSKGHDLKIIQNDKDSGKDALPVPSPFKWHPVEVNATIFNEIITFFANSGTRIFMKKRENQLAINFEPDFWSNWKFIFKVSLTWQISIPNLKKIWDGEV